MTAERRMKVLEDEAAGRSRLAFHDAVQCRVAEVEEQLAHDYPTIEALRRYEAELLAEPPAPAVVQTAVRVLLDDRATLPELRAALAPLFPAGTPLHAMIAALTPTVSPLRLITEAQTRIAAPLEGA